MKKIIITAMVLCAAVLPVFSQGNQNINGITEVAVGGLHACALTSAEITYCKSAKTNECLSVVINRVKLDGNC